MNNAVLTEEGSSKRVPVREAELLLSGSINATALSREGREVCKKTGHETMRLREPQSSWNRAKWLTSGGAQGNCCGSHDERLEHGGLAQGSQRSAQAQNSWSKSHRCLGKHRHFSLPPLVQKATVDFHDVEKCRRVKNILRVVTYSEKGICHRSRRDG